jgi:hypothetical protein
MKNEKPKIKYQEGQIVIPNVKVCLDLDEENANKLVDITYNAEKDVYLFKNNKNKGRNRFFVPANCVSDIQSLSIRKGNLVNIVVEAENWRNIDRTLIKDYKARQIAERVYSFLTKDLSNSTQTKYAH